MEQAETQATAIGTMASTYVDNGSNPLRMLSQAWSATISNATLGRVAMYDKVLTLSDFQAFCNAANT